MSGAVLCLVLLAPQGQPVADREARIRELISEIAHSGRVLQVEETRHRIADPRKQVAPGAPPLLAFRYFQGADRHRFGKLDLMLDDAGH
jgi:hypothetical protein